MRTKQKTPFAAIFPWKCFFRGDLRLAEAKAGLMRNMVVDAFLYPLQRETEISLALDSVNGYFPYPLPPAWRPSLTLPWRQQISERGVSLRLS